MRELVIAGLAAIEPVARRARYVVTDIKNPTLLWIKAGLFVVVGVVATALLVLESPRLKVALLLGVAIWAFCRAYYFAFYVIEHYVAPEFHFSGLGAFVRYAWRKRHGSQEERGRESE